jgi:hypothetical protein
LTTTFATFQWYVLAQEGLSRAWPAVDLFSPTAALPIRKYAVAQWSSRIELKELLTLSALTATSLLRMFMQPCIMVLQVHQGTYLGMVSIRDVVGDILPMHMLASSTPMACTAVYPLLQNIKGKYGACH